MAFFVILIILIVAFAAWQLAQGRRAVATTSVLTRYTEQQAVDIIQRAFSGGAKSLLWTDNGGPGRINKRRRAGTMRGVKQSITMSINITPESNGLLRIDMCASEWASYLGVFVNFAGAVVSREKAIARMLAEPDTAHLAGQVYGGQASAERPYPSHSGNEPQSGQR
jgi:hypothetical protein